MASNVAENSAGTARSSTGHDEQSVRLPDLQHIYDTAPIGLAFLSLDCRYLQINQRLTEICGISVADHLGRSVRETVPALADAIEGIVRSIIATGEPVIGIEVAGQRIDDAGERFWSTYWHPVRGPAGEIIGINVAAEEITERKRADAALHLVIDELSHRIKNLLTVIMAVGHQTARHAGDVMQYQESFTARLQALSYSHDLLVRDSWHGASFNDVVAAQVRPFLEDREDRIETDGPPLVLTPNAVQYLGLAFHELATNAFKHGALSRPQGKISIQWMVDEVADHVGVDWRERDGPLVSAPERRGFGRALVERIVPKALNGTGTLTFAPSGVGWALRFATIGNLASTARPPKIELAGHRRV